MRSWLFCVIILSFSISCNQKESERYIPRKDLIPLLIDMHIADALAMNHSITDQFTDLDSSMIYSSVLNKHGYSKDELLNTMEHYSTKPDKLIKIYDEVFSELSIKAEEAKSVRDKYSISNLDQIWKSETTRFNVTGKDEMYPSAFEFPIDSCGIYVLHASIKMTFNDSSVNPRIIACFFSPDKDESEYRHYFSDTPIPKAKYAREYTLIEECKDCSFTHMRIIIPEYDNEDSAFYKQAEISRLRVGKLKPEKE